MVCVAMTAEMEPPVKKDACYSIVKERGVYDTSNVIQVGATTEQTPSRPASP